MKSTNFNLVRYDADEGKVFDWAEPRFNLDEDGEEIQIHLYAKTLFIGINDSIDNYIEVDEVIEEPETEEEVIEEV
jgi:hypothetical protein